MAEPKGWADVRLMAEGDEDDFAATIQLLRPETVAAIVRGEYDLFEIFSGELAGRGLDADSRFVGNARAEALHRERLEERMASREAF